MRKIFIAFWLLVCCQTVLAQSVQDSLAIIGAKWKVKKIKKGLVWKQAHYADLFGGQQEINLLEVNLKKGKAKLSLRGSKDSLFLTSTWLQDATAGINGSFFNVKDGGGTTLVKKDGILINPTHLIDAQGRNTERANGALLLNGKRSSILPGDISIKGWDRKIEGQNVLVSGPMLISDHSLSPLSKSTFNIKKHPRSAVALSGDHKLVMAVIDGRDQKAVGMTLPELAYFFKIYGVKDALNLDGGGSSTLYVKGEGLNGIVNYPCDNGVFDHLGERKVANVIVVE